MLIGDVGLSGIEGIDTDTAIRIFKDEDGNAYVYSSHAFLPPKLIYMICRVMVRPVPERPGLCFIVVRGPLLDISRACVDRDYLLSHIRTIAHREDIQMGAECAVSDWHLNVRMADAFQKGRIFIAGDAAHVHSPTGGQGLNSGVMDAVRLYYAFTGVHLA